MHPAVFQAYRALRLRSPSHWAVAKTEGAQHFVISSSLEALVLQIAKHEAAGPGRFAGVSNPESGRLLGPAMTLHLEGRKNFILLWGQEGRVGVATVEAEGWCWFTGSITPGRTERRAPDDLPSDIDPLDVPSHLFNIATLLSVIAAPRKVAQTRENGARQYRREYERTVGNPPAAWVKVGWEIGKAIQASGGISLRGHRQALHWRRAHWVAAEKTDPKSEWVKPHGREAGWYTWRSDCWAGHPDFGVKLHRYEPRAPGQESNKGAAVPLYASGPERLALMDEAKRSALRQAGYAV